MHAPLWKLYRALPTHVRKRADKAYQLWKDDHRHRFDAVRDGFGRPHFHSGLGIRRLRQNYFESRAGLAIQLVFRAEKGCQTFFAAGDHAAIRKLLKAF